MIEGAGLLGEGNGVPAAVVLDSNVAFFDVDVGRAVFAQGAEFDQMAIREEFPHGKKDIQRAYDIVHLRKHGVFAIDHRIGRRALLGEVHDGFRFARPKRGRQKIVIGDVADKHIDILTGQVLPHAHTVAQRTNGRERLRAEFMIPQAPHIIVDDSNGVAFL